MRIERLKAAQTCKRVGCPHLGKHEVEPQSLAWEYIISAPCGSRFTEPPACVYWCELQYTETNNKFTYEILATNKDGKEIEFTEEFKELRGVVGCGNKPYFETPQNCPYELEHVLRNESES